MNAICLLSAIASLFQLSYPSNAGKEHAREPIITCPDSHNIPNCQCNASALSCPANLDVSIIATEGEVQVMCNGSFSDLPNLHIGNVKTLSVENCTISADKSLMESFQFLGINSIKNLKYKNRNKKWHRYKAILFGGLQDLEYLLIGVSFEQVELDILNNFTHLQDLVIKDKYLNLQLGIFDSLVELTSLTLSHNNISKLEPGIFRNLRKLKQLNLNNNRLRALNKHIFQGLLNLQNLDLSYNSINSLSADTFDLLLHLTELNLSYNQLGSIQGILTKNHKLKTIILKYNSAPLTLSDYFLSNFSELQQIHLQNLSLCELPEELLRESKAITDLHLSENKIEFVPELLLYDQWFLEYLNLSHNQLSMIPEQFFTVTLRLKVLVLSSNRFENLTGNIFELLISLKELHLQHNRLTHYSACLGMPSLEKLYLQQNNLNDFPTLSSSLIFPSYPQMPLRELDLSYNSISHLSCDDLENFSTRINVNLSHNAISHIDVDSMYQNMSHVMVNLANNPLNCDCELVDFVQYVTVENKSHIKFITSDLHCHRPKELNDFPFDYLHNQDLPCAHFAIECVYDCDCYIRPVDLTVIVNFTGRGLKNIQTLPQLPAKYTSIELHIENNFIKELPTLNLSSYENVREIHARNNVIEKISVNNLPPQLRLLDLTNNKLTTMNKTIVESFNNSVYLKNLHLSDNHWICACTNEDFIRFIQQQPLMLSADKSQINCENGTAVDSINVEKLCGESTRLLMLESLTLVSFGLFIGLLFTLYYCYQIEIKVWLFTHNLLLWLVTEEELDKDKEYDAFISYSHKDSQFIEDILVPRMEHEMKFKTCFHERDWIPGETIPQQIIESVENSRRTIIVLSKNYLESTWAQMEFQTAHLKSLAEKRVRVIIIIFGEIDDVESLGPELKAYLKMNTYVKHEDPWFWDKLRYAMPHPVTATEMKKQNKKRLQRETTL